MASSKNSGSPELLRGVVAAYLRRYLPDGQSSQNPGLIVGFSGGRDSLALLSVLHAVQPEFGFRLAACHVNHRLSPHAKKWQDFCQRYCDCNDIALTVAEVDVPLAAPEGLEAAARAVRYAAFAGADADWLVLGQHRGDQAETLLFNLLRGAGLQGAAGMPETRDIRPGLRLMRPLLCVARRDIEDYLRGISLDWVDDESNDNVDFTRNFLRHRIMPLLLSRFPAAEATLSAAAQRFNEAQSLLDDLALLDLTVTPASFPMPVTCLEDLSEPRARNLLRFMLTRHGVRIPSEARLAEILRQLLNARVDRHPAVVFGDWKIFRKKNQVHLEKIPEF
jgi:tRNA(Ile)-lysidine synthase